MHNSLLILGSVAIIAYCCYSVYIEHNTKMVNPKLFISKKVLIENELQPAAILVSEGKIQKVILGEKFEEVKNDGNVKVILIKKIICFLNKTLTAFVLILR